MMVVVLLWIVFFFTQGDPKIAFKYVREKNRALYKELMQAL